MTFDMKVQYKTRSMHGHTFSTGMQCNASSCTSIMSSLASIILVHMSYIYIVCMMVDKVPPSLPVCSFHAQE